MSNTILLFIKHLGKMPEKGKRPRDIPFDPNIIYADQYLGLAD